MSEMPKTPPKSWRDVIKIHPACNLFPLMTPDELKALGEDIRRNGMTAPVVWWAEREADPQNYQLLDGRNRLDAMELVGIRVIDFNSKTPAFNHNWVWEEARYGEGVPQRNAAGQSTVERTDPFEYVLSANAHRRHLTSKQKRDLVAKVLKAQPSKSNRTIANLTKVDHKTVGVVREKLEERGEITYASTFEDTQGRQQPRHKARRTNAKTLANAVTDRLPDADRLVREIMARDAVTAGYALAVARGIAAELADDAHA